MDYETYEKGIADLIPTSRVDVGTLGMLRKCGLRSDGDGLIQGGITVNFSPDYPSFAGKERILEINGEVSKMFIANSHLFPLFRCHFLSSLEDIATCVHEIGFSVRIADVESFGNNCLVMFSGIARNSFGCEAYYNSVSFDDFLDKIRIISDLVREPTLEHEPIILQQHNGMCGNSFMKWEIEI